MGFLVILNAIIFVTNAKSSIFTFFFPKPMGGWLTP